MAPTEILANQHFKTLKTMLEPYNIKVGLKTGSFKAAGKYDLLVGTHALISDKLPPENIGLMVIDEQQRFGVKQRTLLREKHLIAHYLTMSATPIPRTMALTLYGDLDLSVINELPSGRKIIKTFVVPPEKRDKSYDFIRAQIKKGRQVFIICPLIDPSETLVSVKSAKEEWKKLSTEIYPEYKVELLHGKLKSKAKETIIGRFKKGESNILVATPVVEVGIDVPNATVMVIEASERFGLAQLHQIRGRVGRSDKQSFCFLFSETEKQDTLRRLKNMEKNHIGLELAELDLKLRGPGQIYGTAQHGLPPLKIATLSKSEMVTQSGQAAEKLLKLSPNLQQFSELKNKLAKSTVSPD